MHGSAKDGLKVFTIGLLAVWGAGDLVAGFPNPYYVDGGFIFWCVLKLLGAFILYRAWRASFWHLIDPWSGD